MCEKSTFVVRTWIASVLCFLRRFLQEEEKEKEADERVRENTIEYADEFTSSTVCDLDIWIE